MLGDGPGRPFGPGNLEGQVPEAAAGRDAELQALRQQVQQLVRHHPHCFPRPQAGSCMRSGALEAAQRLKRRCKARVWSGTGVCLALCPLCAGNLCCCSNKHFLHLLSYCEQSHAS